MEFARCLCFAYALLDILPMLCLWLAHDLPMFCLRYAHVLLKSCLEFAYNFVINLDIILLITSHIIIYLYECFRTGLQNACLKNHLILMDFSICFTVLSILMICSWFVWQIPMIANDFNDLFDGFLKTKYLLNNRNYLIV